MTIHTLVYITSKLLPCALDAPSSIIICTDSQFVKLDQCGRPNAFIEGNLLSYSCVPSCYVDKYAYTISYDSDQLISSDIKLNNKSITDIFCKSCQGEWMEFIAGGPVTVEDTGGGQFVLTNQFGCEFVIPTATCESVPDCETPVTAIDTATVEWSLSGQSDHTLSADVQVSGINDNRLSVQGDGLYVPRSTIESVEVAGGCNGIGPGQVIRNAFISSNVLIFDVAPDHTSIGTTGFNASTASLTIPLLTVSFTNPSQCRALQVVLQHGWGYNYTQTSTLINPEIDTDRNGTGFVPTDEIPCIHVPGIPTATYIGKFGSGGQIVFTVAPAATHTETRTMRVRPPADGSTHTPEGWGQAIVMFASTK
jgi:hypothetical protein